MDITRAEQIALDDALVAPANRLKISKTDVLEIYMQEFWATATVHHHSIRFKINNKKHIVNLEYFREMLQICPKLPNQQFKEPPFKEVILAFLRDIGHSGEIKVNINVNVNKLHQPWRSFAAVINKCLSGKSTGYDSLRLSQAQNLWGIYHKKNVDFAYLLWDDFVYQVETKNAKRGYEMYYPCFTKLATKRSLVLTHISHANGFGADEGTGGKPGVLDVPTYESDDEKISWKSSEEEDDDEVGMNDDDNDDANNQDDDSQEDDGQDDKGQDDGNEQTDSDNDGDDFVYPKFSTHDQDERQDEEDGFDPRVQTPSHVESTNDEDNDEEIQGVNVEEGELDKEDKRNELYRDVNVNLEGRDVKMTDAQQKNVQTTQVIEDTHVIITPINPKGQQQSFSVSYGFVSNMLNPSPDTVIDSIFNLNTESTSLVDFLVTTIAEPPLLSATTLSPPPTPLTANLQQIPVPTPANVLSSSVIF
nr:hypothetical protein [Tanacetum cinerariifolium]